MAVFKAYDIRGIYPNQINETLYKQIGERLLVLDRPHTLVIGHDMRDSSKALKDAVVEGATSVGIDVIDIGLASTPMIYQASHDFGVDVGIIITASHNPKEYNGMKVCGKNARPISFSSGLNKIEQALNSEVEYSKRKGEVQVIPNYAEQYMEGLDKYAQKSKLKVVFDPGNGMGGFIDKEILSRYCDLIPIFDELDGSFPNHEANPLKEETLDALKEKIIESGADFGLAFDGDADRVGLVDNLGNFVSADLIVPFLVSYYLDEFPEEKSYSGDLRISKVTKEIVESRGATYHKTPVGHSLIKEVMRKEHCFFGGELAGHFYFWFEEDVIFDSAIRASLELIKAFEQKGEPVSELFDHFKKYYFSPEINFHVDNKEEVLARIDEYFMDGEKEDVDGVTINYPNWWFNVRKSNTEDVLRLKFETNTKELYDEKLELLTSLIEK